MTDMKKRAEVTLTAERAVVLAMKLIEAAKEGDRVKVCLFGQQGESLTLVGFTVEPVVDR